MASPGPSPAPRCAVCGWPLDPDEKFCRVGDCSMRPLPAVLRDPARAIAEYSMYWGPQHVPASWHEQARSAALPTPALPTPEQIAPIAWLECRGCGSTPGHKAGCPGVVAEAALFEALSDALTGGNAGTWDEVIHAADQHCPKRGAITPEQIALVEGLRDRLRGQAEFMRTSGERSPHEDSEAEALAALLTAVTGKDTTP